jgi:hypothetical protein
MLLSAIIRLTAACNIMVGTVYDLAMWTYILEVAHLLSEWLVFGSARRSARYFALLGLASTTLCWMMARRQYHLFHWQAWECPGDY